MQQLHQASQAKDVYALVVTDANMPDTDGFALVEQIKQDAQLRSTTVIMLTSGHRSEDLTRCQQLDIAAYLLKPVKQSELYDAVTAAMGITVAEDEPRLAQAALAARAVAPLKVLLAEDSIFNQKLAVGLLEKGGHSVVVAHNGREALAAWEVDRFDLVLMDVQMPEMDGFEATAAIRARESQLGRHTPIVAMTAHAMKGDRERCLAAGMDSYVAKPIRAADLFATIQAVVEKARS